MKLSQFDPNKETTAFFKILHPVTNEPLIDENGEQVGFETYSDNSKKANASKTLMHSNVLQRKQEYIAELGRPVTTEESSTEEVKALHQWDKDNAQKIETKVKEFVNEEFVLHLGRCCGEVKGSIELDSGEIATSAADVLKENEWILSQLFTFRTDMSNWVPKQPDN